MDLVRKYNDNGQKTVFSLREHIFHRNYQLNVPLVLEMCNGYFPRRNLMTYTFPVPKARRVDKFDGLYILQESHDGYHPILREATVF